MNPTTQSPESILSAELPSVRYTNMGLQVDGRPIDFASYPFLIDLYDLPLTRAPLDVVVIKGAQLGFTTWQILKVIDGAIHTYQNQIGIYFPTEPDVNKFSKSRFARLLDQNPEIASHIKETNSVNIRQIGKVFVFFSGMKSRSAAKSTPNDLNVYDERDEMLDEMVELADRRLDGSYFKHRIEISTPTLPDFGVDLSFQSSTKNHWMVRCTACGTRTCLELEFPRCLVRRPDDTVFRACIKCQREIFPINGGWIAAHPDRDRLGYYVSQLNSPTVHPAEILNEYESRQRDGRDLTEFYNSRLGLPFAAIDDALDPPFILRLCRQYPRALQSETPTILGVDVGKVTHWVVGEKITENFIRTLNWGTVDTLDELGTIMGRYNVRSYVIDQMAEPHKVRSFCSSYPGGYGCYYSSLMRGHLDWNHKERTVTCNRTETLDASHAVIVNGACEFPRADTSLRDELTPQLCNLARVTRINQNTLRPEGRWICRGTKMDHYRHAWNYMVIAGERVSPSIHSHRSRIGKGASFTRARSFMSA